MNTPSFQSTVISILTAIGIMLGIDSYVTIQIAKVLKPPTINNYITLPTSVECSITVYTHQECPNELTAIIEKPKVGLTCAVSRDLIHWLGGQIYIEGIGIRRVNDLTDDKQVMTVDLFMGDNDQAIKFGRQQKLVIFLGR